MSENREPIGVIGTGYVGLVTAAGFAELGNEVYCVDIDAAKIEGLREGRIPIWEPGLAELVAKHRDRLHFSTELSDALENARLLFVAVGTPPTYSGDADLSAVHAVVAHAAGERVVAEPADADVVAVVAGDDVVARAAVEPVVAGAAAEVVGTGVAGDVIVAAQGADAVGAAVARDAVRALGSGQGLSGVGAAHLLRVGDGGGGECRDQGRGQDGGDPGAHGRVIGTPRLSWTAFYEPES